MSLLCQALLESQVQKGLLEIVENKDVTVYLEDRACLALKVLKGQRDLSVQGVQMDLVDLLER